MDVLKLINEIEDIVEEGSTVPFSKKIMVDSEEIKATSYQLQKHTSGVAVAEVLEVYNFEGQDSYYIEFL